MPRTAKCLSGAFSVAVSAEPMMVNVCHCQTEQLSCPHTSLQFHLLCAT